MKKITKILLSSVLAFSMFPIMACGSLDSNDQGNNQPNEPTTPTTPSIEETGHNLIKDGVSEYAILLPENATPAEKLSATELNTFFAEASGIILPIITEGSAQADNVDKYISIGKTECAENNSVSMDNLNLGYSGYLI